MMSSAESSGFDAIRFHAVWCMFNNSTKKLTTLIRPTLRSPVSGSVWRKSPITNRSASGVLIFFCECIQDLGQHSCAHLGEREIELGNAKLNTATLVRRSRSVGPPVRTEHHKTQRLLPPNAHWSRTSGNVLMSTESVLWRPGYGCVPRVGYKINPTATSVFPKEAQGS